MQYANFILVSHVRKAVELRENCADILERYSYNESLACQLVRCTS